MKIVRSSASCAILPPRGFQLQAACYAFFSEKKQPSVMSQRAAPPVYDFSQKATEAVIFRSTAYIISNICCLVDYFVCSFVFVRFILASYLIMGVMVVVFEQYFTKEDQLRSDRQH